MKTDAKPMSLFSRFVRQGKRSFFFDVYEQNSHRWLAITESRQMDDGKYVRNRITVEPDAAGMFAACLQESVKRLAQVPTSTEGGVA